MVSNICARYVGESIKNNIGKMHKINLKRNLHCIQKERSYAVNAMRQNHSLNLLGIGTTRMGFIIIARLAFILILRITTRFILYLDIHIHRKCKNGEKGLKKLMVIHIIVQLGYGENTV